MPAKRRIMDKSKTPRIARRRRPKGGMSADKADQMGGQYYSKTIGRALDVLLARPHRLACEPELGLASLATDLRVQVA